MLLSTNQQEWNGYTVHQMPIDSLFITVAPDEALVNRIMESIREQGLINPILIVNATPRQYADKCMLHPDLIPNHTPSSNYVYGGSNRVHAALRLGYAHIDVVLIPTFDEAWQLQFAQRETKF